MSQPAMFIMDEPTRGVDVAAKYDIYTIVDQLAADGGGVLFISSELEELIAMCDRILVMSRGEIVGAFERANFDEERILRAAFREGSPHDPDCRARLIDFLLRPPRPSSSSPSSSFSACRARPSSARECGKHRQAGVLHRRNRGRHDLRPADGRHRPLGGIEHVPLGDGCRLLPAVPAMQNGAGAVVAVTSASAPAPCLAWSTHSVSSSSASRPFLVTLATLVAGRGLGTAITESFGIEFPKAFTSLGTWSLVRAPEVSDGSFLGAIAGSSRR